MCLGSLHQYFSSLGIWSTGIPAEMSPPAQSTSTETDYLILSEKTNPLLCLNLSETLPKNVPRASTPAQRTSSLETKTTSVHSSKRYWDHAVERRQFEPHHPLNTQRGCWDNQCTGPQLIPLSSTIGYSQSLSTRSGVDSSINLSSLESEFQRTSDVNDESTERIKAQKESSSSETVQSEPHTWGYSSDNTESLARSARAIENTLRLAATYLDSYEATKPITPP
ncbi:hypothetical protein F5050DRAFT_1114362 [Lentinula boryana]|uniref:Uncharacterized protein n=1 Tax=Lentinula boryana TaxID=40481 RepID=A0ABQ8PYY8_9AGAR|nr:hypothetical protein F5050DRAFT_1114362 [Lentinula boryana]